MIKLFCAIDGVRGDPFLVIIDPEKCVTDLKEAIKEKIQHNIQCDARDLELFLANTGNGQWLPDDHDAALELYTGKTHADVKMMLLVEKIIPSKTVDFWLKKHDMPPPSAQQIHVLLVLPDYASDLETDAYCGTVLNTKVINDIVGFVGTEFYIRKEILCVLENFKKTYQQEFATGEAISKQFILMGSPGTGKSCILALISFNIAVVYKRPVVWFRQVNGGWNSPITTRLFYQGKYYEWEDVDGKIYAGLYDALKASGVNVKTCWFCLDGMPQNQIVQKSLFNRFRLLATSGQFSVKAEASEYSELCLVPYWRQEDLEDIGKIKGMQESTVAARSFESGGILRDFLSDRFSIVRSVLRSIENYDDTEYLLTDFGGAYDTPIDHIRMQGVPDRNNVDHYTNVWKWVNCVTSRLALNHMAPFVKPNFFGTLESIAKGMEDERLEDIAFEGYFHALVSHHQIHVVVRKYDNVDRSIDHNWKKIMEQTDVVECKQLSLGKDESKCTNMKQCLAAIEKWAANPSEMDYWIPATSLCDTVDAVAKWTFPNNVDRFCFLQLTIATTHKCNADVLWELVEPFVKKNLEVCYIVLIRDKDKVLKFRLDPEQITKREILDNVPLYVAHFEEGKEGQSTSCLFTSFGENA